MLGSIGSLINIQGLNREKDYQLLLNDKGVSLGVGLSINFIIKNSYRPIPLSFKNDIKTAALGNVALGKSLINQPLAQYLLDYLLGRSFGFVS
jgi:hypothetical protein